MQKRTDNFGKFANKKKGSAIKEAIRQEKKKIKAEARAAGEEMRQKKIEKMRGIRQEQEPSRKPAHGKGRTTDKPFNRKADSSKAGPAGYKKSAARPEGRTERPAASSKEPRRQQRTDNRMKTDHQPDKKNEHISSEQMPLNKFIAHAGVCGRREAAELVKEGKVVVNGDKVFEPGYKVSAKDKVTVKGKQVFLQKNAVYILLNKPKDFITTSNDPQGRKTVLDLVKGAIPERIYPVGRLDRNTTGVLLLTNDGELAQKLTHPSFEIKKIYEVTLDKPVTKKDLESILSGITLEDGVITADAVGYADAKDKSIVGIEIHSGKNRIVRRIFEHLGYDVKALDRVMFANLTKKNVDRSKWRFLTEKEVRLLKYMNKSFVRNNKNAPGKSNAKQIEAED
ncbi:pseudouridine synthase [Sediminibacterium ginsengisoli]|uniref:Pseudouridine synthase n=1 Tax=Sediminibacterium ginsengisoli TaxID=413434 RepID=A0A1T4NB60_9BACT|nr:pseudouridine synthase [Sediminibacterium ginsengisoli]SJZ76323.1 23S rRNA pseudouridine2605 synthase [Sediminibacterium ginsengisoli]